MPSCVAIIALVITTENNDVAFEYDVKFYRGPEEEFDFPNLRDGASMWCAERPQALEVAQAFNRWALKSRSPLAATEMPVSPNDHKKRGWRVWIMANSDGPDALRVDPLPVWAELRVEQTGQEPAGGWAKTTEFYQDYVAWAASRGLKKTFMPPANTFTQRLKSIIDAQFKRRAEGMIIIGATLKKTDLEAANGIDPEPL